jgi:hypothetical protein
MDWVPRRCKVICGEEKRKKVSRQPNIEFCFSDLGDLGDLGERSSGSLPLRCDLKD